MSKRDYCTITILPEGPADVGARLSVALKFSYDLMVIDALKKAIPSADRRWDKDRRTWWVAPRHLEELKVLARTLPEATLIEGDAETDLHTGKAAVQGRLF